MPDNYLCNAQEQLPPLAARLKQDGFSVRAFHGKMDIKDKTENQNDFISGIVQIMVATSASLRNGSRQKM